MGIDARRWCVGAAVSAQNGSGTLTRVVADAADARLPGASITVTAAGTALSPTAVTAVDGGYSIPGLLPGLYTVQIELTGFRRLTHERVRIATGDATRLSVTHQVGGPSETPVRRNSTFFFVDCQGQRQTIGRTVISTVPTALPAPGYLHRAHRGVCRRFTIPRRRRRPEPA